MKKKIKSNRFTMSRAENEYNFDSENVINNQKRSSRRAHLLQIALASGIFLVCVALLVVFLIFYKKPDLGLQKDSNIFSKLLPQESGKEEAAVEESKPSHPKLADGIRKFSSGNYPEAISLFYEVVEGDADDKDKAEALMYLGKIELINENWTKALGYFERALKYNDKNSVVYLNLAKASFELGKNSEALAYLDKGLNKNPDSSELYFAKGNTLFKLKKYLAASKAYKSSTELDPEHAYAWYNRGLALLKLGERFEAIENLKRAAGTGSGRIGYLAYSRLGTLFLEGGDTESAIKYFNLALKLDGSSPDDLFNLGLAYISKGDKNSAIDYFQKAEELGSENLSLLQRLGDIYAETYQNYPKGIELYKKVAEKNSKNVTVLFKLGELFYNNQDYNSSLVYFSRIVDLEPASQNAHRAYLYIGNIYDETLRFHDAIEAFKKALTIKPDDDAALYNLGIAYSNLGDKVGAIESWKKAYAANPDNPRALIAIADGLYDDNYLDEAALEYTKIIEKWPANAEAQFSLATIYNKKGIKDTAEKFYKRVVALETNKELTRKALINLALISVDKADDVKEGSNSADSITYVKKALLISPNDTEALHALGIIYYKKALYERAVETFYEVVKASRDAKTSASAYNDIGKCWYKKKEYKKAVHAFSLGIEEDPSNEEIRINRRAASQMYEKMIGGEM